MSISKKFLSVIMAVFMAVTMIVAVPATASAAESVRINEVNAQVGQQIVYDLYVQTNANVSVLEGRLNFDNKVLSLRTLDYSIDKNIVGTTTTDGTLTTINFKGTQSNYDTSSKRADVIRAVFDVVATSSKYVEDPTADAVSACFTNLKTAYGEDLMKSDFTNITTRTIIAATSVTMAKTSVTLLGKNDNETVKVKAVGPVNNDIESSYVCTYKSSNTKVAKVSGRSTKVKITAVGPGECTITCTPDGALTSTKIKVTVKQPVSKITLSPTKKSIKVKRSFTIKAKVTPTNASNKAVTWKTSDKKIATVSTKGVVKGVKAGKATITATAKDGSKKSAKCTVTVTK